MTTDPWKWFCRFCPSGKREKTAQIAWLHLEQHVRAKHPRDLKAAKDGKTGNVRRAS